MYKRTINKHLVQILVRSSLVAQSILYHYCRDKRTYTYVTPESAIILTAEVLRLRDWTS